jgi:succinyl-CoA synthetase beta subunit
MAQKVGFSPKCQEAAASVFEKLYKLFIEKDATLVEINPLAETSTGKGICHLKQQ